jgi:hypothetical protein
VKPVVPRPVRAALWILALLAPAMMVFPAAPAATKRAAEEAARKAAAGEGPILAGAAAHDITPPVGGTAATVTLAGFGEGRLATGVRDPIFARALVLESGGAAFGLVTLDLFAIDREDVEAIRREARSRLEGKELSGLLVAATGTRFGPDLQGVFSSPGERVDPAWRNRLVSETAAAIAEAWRDRKPARLSFATTRLPRLLEDSRRPLRLDDQAFLLRLEHAQSRVGIAAVAGFSAAPETLPRGGREISAEWPGGAAATLEGAFGGVGMILPGAQAGRMQPASEPAGPEAFGAAVARALVVAWSGRAEGAAPMPADLTTGRIVLRTRSLAVPIETAEWRDAVARGVRRGSESGTERSTEVAALRITGAGLPVLDLACIPGVPFPELVNGGIETPQESAADLPGAPVEAPLRSFMPAPVKMIAAACGDDLGDLLPASEWDARPPFAYGLASAPRGEERSPGPRTASVLWRAFAELFQ